MGARHDSQSASRPDVPPSTNFPSGLLENRDLARARQYLKDLSVHYDRYLDSIFDKYYRWNHMESEIDEIIGNVKDHLFWPDDARLTSDSFWLWRYLPGERGRLRYYLTTCAKNFARDKLRKKHPLRLSAASAEAQLDVPAPTSSQLLDNARHVRATLTEHAKNQYLQECGAESGKWRAFELSCLGGEKSSPAEVARRLDITEHMVNNYNYNARQRIMELIWLALYDMEKTDILNEAIVAIDMAVLTAIAAEAAKRTDTFYAPRSGYDDASAMEAREVHAAKEAAASEAADSDMVELFGFLPKLRTRKKMPKR